LDGEVICFGKKMHGRCRVPLDLPSVRAVSAGVRHTCAITQTDRLVCFGDDWFVPDSIGSVKAVAAADDLTYALTHGGQVVCLQPHGQVRTLFVHGSHDLCAMGRLE